MAHPRSFISTRPGACRLLLAAACLAGGTIQSHAGYGLAREAYGVWDREGLHNIVDYPYTHGQILNLTWGEVNPARNSFEWAQKIGPVLDFAEQNNQMFTVKVSPIDQSAPNKSMPAWMFGPLTATGGGLESFSEIADPNQPTVTPSAYVYAKYTEPQFKVYFEEMVNSFASYLRTQLTPSRQARIAFVRVDTGCTGDEEAYENPSLIPQQYRIDAEAWRSHREWVFEVYRKAFQEGPGPTIPLLFAHVEPGVYDHEWEWVTTHVTGGFGAKLDGATRGHHLTDSGDTPRAYKEAYALNPNFPMFSRSEMDNTWNKRYFQNNIRMGMYWCAVEQLNSCQSIWDVSGECMEAAKAYSDPVTANPRLDFKYVFDFFNKWAAEIDPPTARGGFCIFHRGLDVSDTDTFPLGVTYGDGALSLNNSARYTKICEAFAAQGAAIDDLNGATTPQVGQRNNGLIGYNDAGWNIHAGNYDRFITQIDPEGTSKALWRVRGTLTRDTVDAPLAPSASDPYDRFARRSDHASGKDTMYFNLDDNLFPTAGQPVQLIVEYLDRGTGQFSLLYDAESSAQKTAFTVTKTNSNEWKSMSTYVTDWHFGNRGSNGSDLQLVNLATDSANPDTIFHGIEVVKLGSVTVSKQGQGTVNARNNGLYYNPLLSGLLDQGMRLELAAVPSQGWTWGSWLGDLAGKTNPIVFVGQNTPIAARFDYTGIFTSDDDFESGSWSGGSYWSGGWTPSGAATVVSTTTATKQIVQLNGGGQIVRTLTEAVPNNSVLTFLWDLDRISSTESGTVEALYENGWKTVWNSLNIANAVGSDNGGAADNMLTATVNLNAFGGTGKISQIRFKLNANASTDRFWIDNVNITGTIPAPVFAANPFSKADATEDAAYSGTLVGSATTQSGATLTYSIVEGSGPAWLHYDAATGALSGTPGNSDVGDNSWDVVVSAGLYGTATAKLHIQVANVNDAPVFSGNVINLPAINEDSAISGLTLAGLASDVDAGAQLTYAIISGPAWLSVDLDGTLHGTPDDANVGSNSWTVQVSDGLGGTATATLNIAVANVNDAPVVNANPISKADATEDAAYSGTLAGSASDEDAGAQLTYTSLSGPAWLSVDSDGALHGTPGNSDVGQNSWTVQVSDGLGGTATATLNITVANVNDAPVFTINPIAGGGATQGQAYSGTLAGSAADIDAGDTISYSIASGPAWLQVAGDGSLSGAPGNSDVGSAAFVVRVTDAAGATATATLNISVANVNDAPVFAANPFSKAGAAEDAAYSGTLAGSASDVDAGAVLSYSIVPGSGPAWLSVDSEGTLHGTPANSDGGANSWTVQVSDGLGGTATATLNITVANVNDAPVFTVTPINKATATAGVNYSSSGQSLAGSATDEEGAALSYTMVTSPAWLQVASDGTLSGTPQDSDVGDNSFTVRVSDGVASSTAVLNITVVKLVACASVSAEDGFVTGTPGGIGSAANSTNSAGGALRLGDDANNKQTKAIVSFNTSQIPVGATIVSATLKLKKGVPSGDPSNLGVITIDIAGATGFGGNTALAASDFEADAGAAGVATMNYQAATTDYSAALNASGLLRVNKTGNTQLRLQFATSTDNDGLVDYLGLFSGENTSNKPVLEVVYK